VSQRDRGIDAYIERSVDFARPILRHLREVVREACPQAQETMKWSFPHFGYKGILCSMAAFKAHCAFNFWSGAEVLEGDAKHGAMGQLGRITSVKDLPSKKVLAGYVKKAMALKDAGVKPAWAKARAAKAKSKVVSVPAQPPARVRRVDCRGQAPRDADKARGSGGGEAQRIPLSKKSVRGAHTPLSTLTSSSLPRGRGLPPSPTTR